jgi:hypothetical protein
MSEKKPIKGKLHLEPEQEQEVELRFLTSYKGGVEGTSLHIIIPETGQGIVINHNNLVLLKEELNQISL